MTNSCRSFSSSSCCRTMPSYYKPKKKTTRRRSRSRRRRSRSFFFLFSGAAVPPPAAGGSNRRGSCRRDHQNHENVELVPLNQQPPVREEGFDQAGSFRGDGRRTSRKANRRKRRRCVVWCYVRPRPGFVQVESGARRCGRTAQSRGDDGSVRLPGPEGQLPVSLVCSEEGETKIGQNA